MVLGPLGSIIGGLTSVIGGKMSSDTSAKAARLNAIYQAQQNQLDRTINQQNYALARKDSRHFYNRSMKETQRQFRTQLKEAAKDRQLQQDFAQHGVQWRVADAKEAGIHPLAALGAQLATSSPISISGGTPSGSAPSASSVQSNPISPFTGATGFGEGLANMGQDISRAFTATATELQRQKELDSASKLLSLENQALQNRAIASGIARTRGAAVGPAFPAPSTRVVIQGQGDSATKQPTVLVEPQTHQPVVSAPGAPHAEPGEITDLGYARTPTGWAPVQSKDSKERNEDDIIAEANWHVRNRLPQMMQQNLRPPPHVTLPPDKKWWFNPLAQEYQIKHKGNPEKFWENPTTFQ